MRSVDVIYLIGCIFGRMPKVVPVKKIIQLFMSGFYGTKFASCGKRFRISTPVKFINGAHYIHVGDDVCIHPFVRLEAIKIVGCPPPVISIGNRCGLGYNTQINASNRIDIGDDVLFASNVYITDHYHGDMSAGEINTPPSLRRIYSKGPVFIGVRCWLGQNVCVMPNVKISDGCIIGANSVVTHDIPPYAVAAGTPAKVIKMLR